MTLWGATLTPEASTHFLCDEQNLDLTQATLVNGGDALLKVKLKSGAFYVIGRLTAARPNLRIRLVLEEDAEFLIEGSNDAEMCILGNERAHNHKCINDDCSEGDSCKEIDDALISNESELDEEESNEESEKTEIKVEAKELHENDLDMDIAKPQASKSEKKVQQQSPPIVAVPADVVNKAGLGSQLNGPKDKKRKHSVEVEASSKRAKVDCSPKAKKGEAILSQPTPEPKKKDPSKPTPDLPKKTPPTLVTKQCTSPKSTAAPGIMRELPGGVKYEILMVGNGKVAAIGKRIKVKYEGRLARNGKKFDSGTLDFTIGSGDMIQGFDLGSRGMMMREKRRVFIPARLGYGKQRMGTIPPNSDLIFDIQLLSTN